MPHSLSLHVLEEILEAMQIDELSDETGVEIQKADENQAVLTVEPSPHPPNSPRQTLKLLAQIGNTFSAHACGLRKHGTFVSDQLVKHLQLQIVPCQASTFRAVDGSVMLCNQQVPMLTWSIQGQTFKTEAKVLPLRCYDLILGEDWLEEHSPMVVDYKLKTMEVTSAGQKVKLQGVVDDISSCPPITQKKLAGLLRRGAVSHCIQMTVPTMEEWIPSVCSIEDSETADIPSAVSELIQQFDHLFAEPKALPPRRTTDHHIPLVSGARPVKVRPYRYSPIQKAEIEM